MNGIRRPLLAAASLGVVLAALACDRRSAPVEIDTSVFGPAVRDQIDAAIEASADEPDDVEAQARLAMLLHSYQQLEPAITVYERAVELDPETFRWRYYLGRALFSAGRNEEALARLDEALAIRADYAPAHVAVGDLRLEAGATAAALESYRRSLALDPESARAHYGVAKALRALGRDDEAVSSLRSTLRLAPRFGAAHYSLGMLYRDLGDDGQAARHLEMAASLRDSRAPARDPLMAAVIGLVAGAGDLTKRALELYADGRTGEAIENLDAALELDPDFVPARVNLIKLHGDAGRWDLAEEHYRAAIATSPNAQQARFNYARVLIQQRRLDEAGSELERVTAINPHHADAQVLLGSILEEAGDLAAAVRRYELAVESKPAHPQANMMLARHRLEAGRLDAAEEHARRLLESETESLPILVYRLGLSYLQAGQSERGREYLLQARELARGAGRERLVREIDARLEDRP